jgi:predicted adenine nucleotide alpha hydrolase (AANH) superfamily ATPase
MRCHNGPCGDGHFWSQKLKILLHICCAPCAIFPIQSLRADGFDLRGFFYRHNIHPYTECLKRQQALEVYAKDMDVAVIYQKSYDIERFLRTMAFRETERCRYCYYERLASTARLAKRGKFDCFSTTLLYSKFQKHDLIRSIGDTVSREMGIPFYYQDFREGWKTGVEKSKHLGMYRQQYCGCLFSEKERYFQPPRP